MCLGSSPNAPTPPPALPEAPRTPDAGARAGNTDADKRRRGRGTGIASTILTSPLGAQQQGGVGAKTLLGA